MRCSTLLAFLLVEIKFTFLEILVQVVNQRFFDELLPTKNETDC